MQSKLAALEEKTASVFNYSNMKTFLAITSFFILLLICFGSMKSLPSLPVHKAPRTTSERNRFLKNEGVIFGKNSERVDSAIENLRNVLIALNNEDIDYPELNLRLKNWVQKLEINHLKLGANVDEIVRLLVILQLVPPAADVELLLTEAEETNDLARDLQYELQNLLEKTGYDISQQAKKLLQENEDQQFILHEESKLDKLNRYLNTYHPVTQDTDWDGINDGDEDFDADGLSNADRSYQSDNWPANEKEGSKTMQSIRQTPDKDENTYQVSAPKVIPQLIDGDPPVYPKHLQMRGIEGSTKLLITVEACRVIETKVLSSTSNLFTRACKLATKDWKFSLSPNRAKLQQTFHFNLPSSSVQKSGSALTRTKQLHGLRRNY